MVRFGKLDSVDEGEDRVEKILRPVATKKKKTTVIVLTSSDEDEDEEEEADEAGAPLGPGKRQQPGLVRLNPLPQIRHPTVMAPTPLHGESTVGIGFSRTFLTSRDGQDSSASRAGNTGGDTQVRLYVSIEDMPGKSTRRLTCAHSLKGARRSEAFRKKTRP